MIGTNKMMVDGQMLKERRAEKTTNFDKLKYTSPLKNSINQSK